MGMTSWLSPPPSGSQCRCCHWWWTAGWIDNPSLYNLACRCSESMVPNCQSLPGQHWQRCQWQTGQTQTHLCENMQLINEIAPLQSKLRNGKCEQYTTAWRMTINTNAILTEQSVILSKSRSNYRCPEEQKQSLHTPFGTNKTIPLNFISFASNYYVH